MEGLDEAYGTCQPAWPKLMPDYLVERKLFEINLDLNCFILFC